MIIHNIEIELTQKELEQIKYFKELDKQITKGKAEYRIKIKIK